MTEEQDLLARIGELAGKQASLDRFPLLIRVHLKVRSTGASSQTLLSSPRHLLHPCITLVLAIHTVPGQIPMCAEEVTSSRTDLSS
jgi:hypothetical protein